MLRLLIEQIASQSIFFFLQLTNLEVSLFVKPYQLHIQITNFILLLFTILLEFSNLKLVLLVITQVMSFNTLDLQMILVFQFTDLYVFGVLNISDVFSQFFYLVDELPILQVRSSSAIDCQSFILILPDFYLVLFLIDKFGQSLIFSQELIVMLDDQLGLILQFIYLLALLLQNIHLLNQTCILSLQ